MNVSSCIGIAIPLEFLAKTFVLQNFVTKPRLSYNQVLKLCCVAFGELVDISIL
jgi:hypothetical protein